jgi:sporulation protein YlmC with PRC-barrel domain
MARIALECLSCAHRASMSEDDLPGYGLEPGTSLVTRTKRTVCRQCGGLVVVAYRLGKDDLEADCHKVIRKKQKCFACETDFGPYSAFALIVMELVDHVNVDRETTLTWRLLMRSNILIGGLLASTLIVPALAQPNPPAPAATPGTAQTTTTSPTAAHSDLWRSSKLIGLDVYNDQNEKLGDVSEILVDKTGKVAGLVIGVGGFLGMGQHDIMVEMSRLKFVEEPVKTATTTTTGTATSSATTTTTNREKKWYPDHAVLSGATKDQLKAMPQFKYD